MKLLVLACYERARSARESSLDTGIFPHMYRVSQKSFYTLFRRQWPLKGRFQMIFPYIWALPESLEQGELHATHLFSI